MHAPINDRDIEYEVLATLMAYQLMDQVQQILTADCFLDAHNRLIYQTIHSCYLEGRDYNFINVTLELAHLPGHNIQNYEVMGLIGKDNRNYTGKLAGQETHGTASLTTTKGRNIPIGHIDFLRFHGGEMYFSVEEIKGASPVGEYDGLF